jgi:hypothetical protein
LIDRLERKFNRFAIPRLTYALIAGQVIVFLMSMVDESLPERLLLDPRHVAAGEYWRLVTFIFLSESDSWVMFLIFVWVNLLFGRALEQQWGDFKFNLYMLLGYLTSVATAFLLDVSLGNYSLMLAIFFAFAVEFPDFELLLFFVLPVKVRILAIALWCVSLAPLVFSPGPSALAKLTALGHFFIFFGPGMVARFKARRRREVFEARMEQLEEVFMHRCEVCGMTEDDDSEMMFRVCSNCNDGQEYCEAHIRDHEHVG